MWLTEQEAAGIDIVSDGEQFREHFVHGFLHNVDGIDWNLMTPMGIRDDRYTVDVPTVTRAVSRRGPTHSEEARFTRAHTDHRLKFTLPGPMTICDTIADAHYGRRADMAMAFAELLNEEARELDAIGVDPGSQGRGIGRQLLAGLDEVLRHKGVHEMHTQEAWTNHELMRFFDAAGFRLAPRQVLELRVADAAGL